MHFKRDQPVMVSQGWSAAGRKGIYLCSMEVDGRTWHIVQLSGDAAPTVLMDGTIEADTSGSDSHPKPQYHGQ